MIVEFTQDNHVVIDFHEIVNIFRFPFVRKVHIDAHVDVVRMASHCCLWKYGPRAK